MIVLSEYFGPFPWVGDGVVLKCIEPVQILWNLENTPSPGPKNPVEFFHGPCIIWNVFQYVVAKDDIEGIVDKWQVTNIRLNIGQGGVEVRCNVIQIP